MNRADAYAVLASRLDLFRRFGHTALLPLVDEPAVCEIVRVNGEDLTVEIRVAWTDAKHRDLSISGTVYGPSTWMMERLDERLVLRAGAADETEDQHGKT